MVLVPHTFKEDKEIERELEKKRRVILSQPCTFAPHEEEIKPIELEHITEKLVDRMALQELRIKYLLDLITTLGVSEQLELKKIEDPKIVVIEEISKEDAKKRIEDYFEEHEEADIEELMLNLRIPIQTIVEIIDELRGEGKLEPQGENT